jgi:hypothetical protein
MLGVGRGADNPHPVKLGFVSKPQLKPRKRKKGGEARARKRAKAPQKKKKKKKKHTLYTCLALNLSSRINWSGIITTTSVVTLCKMVS